MTEPLMSDIGSTSALSPCEGHDGPPLFVLGCGRSGTTMLRMMLTTHSELAIPWESHFIVPLWKARKKLGGLEAPDVERIVAHIQSTSMFRLWELPNDAVRRRVDALERPTFGEVIGAVFQAYADHQSKCLWGDKTPIYVNWIPVLANLFPTARFVHVIRDGRDVAMSYQSVPWGPDDIWGCAIKWRRDVGAGRRYGPPLGNRRYMEVRYETLVREARPVLEQICDFAGLAFDERMLDYRQEARKVGSRPAQARYHASATKPPTPGLRDWRSQMPENQVLAFEAVAGDLLVELGYERRHPSVHRMAQIEAAARIASAKGKTVASKTRKMAMRMSRGSGLGDTERHDGRLDDA